MKRPVLLILLVPALTLAYYDLEWFDLNHWKVSFLNDGRWGYNPEGSGSAAGSWPQPLLNYYVFGAGTWLGAVVGSSPQETLCTFFYNPNSGGTEACPTLCRYWSDSTNAADHIYQYPGDWPPPLSRFPMAPQVPRSDMDMWCAYGDSDPENHISPGRPLGVDIYQTIYGFNDSLARDFFYIKCEIANCSGDSLRDSYFGPALDPDIGDGTGDGADVILDHVFVVDQETIKVRNLVFTYDFNNMEQPGATWESGTPGTMAIALLDAPDSLGLTAFKRFSIDIDPTTDAAQYLTMAGYDYRTGEFQPYDSTDNHPRDKRFVMPSGPFNLAPDSTVTFWYVVIGSPFGTAGQWPSQRDTSDLALRYKWALEFWRRLFSGIEETPTAEVRMPNCGATLVRKVLSLPVSPFTIPTSLFDMTGRQVMSLRPGANDVSRLSPGVYFVRAEGSTGRGPVDSNIRKIVVAR